MSQDRERATPAAVRAWMNRARENLELARHSELSGVSLSLLAFHAQQAAELALKAVYHLLDIYYQRTHDLQILARGLEEAGVSVPADVEEAAPLTRYAVRTRYPGMSPPMTLAEHEEAIRLAQGVLNWADGLIKEGPGFE